MNRHLSRVIVMQTLYENDFRPKADINEILKRNIDNYGEDVDPEYINSTLEGVNLHLKEIDQAIATAAPEWPLEQISLIDKTILRLAVFELLFDEQIPPKVAINEAVELGKTFGGQNSSKFINGVLGTVFRGSPRYDASTDEKKESNG